MRRLVPLVAGLALLAGCARQDPADQPGPVRTVLSASGELIVGSPDAAKTAEARAIRLQTEVNDLADLYAAQVAEGSDRVRRATAAPEDRLALHRWRLSNATNAWNAASTCETPERGLIDLMTITALARAVAESKAHAYRDMPEAQRLFEIHCANERKVWERARVYLPAEHIAELRTVIDKAVAANPKDHALLSLRLNDLFPDLGAGGDIKRTGGLLGLLSLDPFSGLDPTTRAINDSRRSAERMLYRVERMQFVLRWQMEQFIDGLAASPDGARLLTDLHRLGLVAEALPARIGEERAAIVAALEANQGKLTELAAQTRGALEAGRGMADSLDRLLHTFTALVARFDRPSAAGSATAAPSRPFDIEDYRRTALEIGHSADSLDRLVHSASQAADSPAVDRHLARIDQAVARLERSGDALLVKAAGALAGLILLAGAVALAVRRLGR